MEASKKGSEEILMAVISTTIVLAAMFLPVVFLSGITGKLFREFGIVLAGSVLISAFVSLTLTPMMCSRLLKKEQSHNWFYRKTEPFFQGMTNAYRGALITFLDRRWLAWGLVALTGVGIWFFMKTLPSELAPVEDRNRLSINATAPELSLIHI